MRRPTPGRRLGGSSDDTDEITVSDGSDLDRAARRADLRTIPALDVTRAARSHKTRRRTENPFRPGIRTGMPVSISVRNCGKELSRASCARQS
ncbi:hypothetical protein GCM10023094_34740 [Rhodococcus olei]|uniref:Uncharacterized protein n=1 Tax=Rhodococcus olei TaxID=2161675 RepID=A0ABP8PAY5_9NOCA